MCDGFEITHHLSELEIGCFEKIHYASEERKKYEVKTQITGGYILQKLILRVSNLFLLTIIIRLF